MRHQHSTSDTTQILTVAAAAALIGGAIAILATPRTGKQVRSDLKRRTNDLVDQIMPHVKDVNDLDEVVEAVRERLQKAAEEAAADTKKAETVAKDAKKTVTRAATKQTAKTTTRK